MLHVTILKKSHVFMLLAIRCLPLVFLKAEKPFPCRFLCPFPNLHKAHLKKIKKKLHPLLLIQAFVLSLY